METATQARSWGTLDWLNSVSSLAIPVYQREYRWTVASCEQLLADIKRAGTVGGSHFIGSLLVAGDTDQITLVDGQQRMTTLMLILAALRDVADDPEISTATATMLLDPTDPARPKLRAQERYEAVAERLFTSQSDGAGDSALDANYVALAGMIGDDWRTVWAGVQRLEQVVILLDGYANAQQIFESLNSTGARLSDEELIHNYIHMGRVHAEQLEMERQTWVPIELATRGETRAFWRDYLVWASDEQPDLAGEFGIYRAFRHRYPDPRNDLTMEVQAEWVRHAEWYGALLDPDEADDPDVQSELRWVTAFEGAPRPLLLGMYGDLAQHRISATTFVEAIRQLQTMFVRRALVNLDRDIAMIGRLCRELRTNGYPLEGLVRLTPEDPQVRLALAHGTLPHSWYVLQRIQKPSRDLKNLQVEHIYPQTPRPDWSGDDGATTWGNLSTAMQAEYRTVLNTIGNLTLLEAPLNQGASNRSFDEKTMQYYSRSQVPANGTFASHKRWDMNAIKARTERLTEAFLTEWPRQGDVPMTGDTDLTRVVDLPKKPVRGYPEMFEYATFEGEVWGDVRTAKDLLARVVFALWTRDEERFANSEHAWVLRKQRVAREAHVVLPNGLFLYSGWANQYLIATTQEFIVMFGLEDQVKVRQRDELTKEESPDEASNDSRGLS